MAGFIELIAKIKPKNNGKYALVDDADVEMEDGSRLSEAIKKPRIPDGGTEGQILAKKSNTNGDAEWVDPLKTEDIDKKLESKLDKNLGSKNSDKVLITDAEGNIITQNKEDFEGGGGTTDYNNLENKPQINGVELKGNKTSSDLKMYTQEEVDDLLYDKMDKPYKPITITDDITIEDCLDGCFKINKILGNTYQAEESDIVPTPQRPIPINSRKTTITKINPNIFNLEKESDTSNIPDSGTYRSIGQYQLKANTKYVFSWSEATVPAKATLSFQVQDDKGTVLVSLFTYFNLESTEKKETGKEVEFTTNSSGIVKFAYNCTVATSSTTETYQQYWYTKILKDISLKEDAEYTSERVELRSLKETSNLFDKNIMAFTSGTLNSDGTVGTNASYAVSGFVPVEPSTQYTIKVIDGFRGSTKVYFDINKQAISNDGTTTFTTPSNCYFVRWQTATTDTRVLTEEDIQKINDEMMMVKGDSLPSSYVPPTVRDYKIVDHTAKTAKIVRNVHTTSFNKNSEWSRTGDDKKGYRFVVIEKQPVKVLNYSEVNNGFSNMSNNAKNSVVNDNKSGSGWYCTSNSYAIKVDGLQMGTLDDFKQLLGDNEIIFQCQLQTPTEESIAYVETDVSEVGYSWQDTTSPSPTIKSEVKGVEKIDILKTGKNLFDVDYVSNLKNWTNPNTDGYFYIPIKVPKGKQLCLSNDKTIASGRGYYANLSPYKDKNAEDYYFFYHNTLGSAYGKFNKLTKDEVIYLRLNSITNNLSLFIEDFKHLQLEVGDTATAYEPYTEQRVNITPPQPLYSTLDGSIADEVDVEKGVYRCWLLKDKIENLATAHTNVNFAQKHGNFQSYSITKVKDNSLKPITLLGNEDTRNLICNKCNVNLLDYNNEKETFSLYVDKSVVFVGNINIERLNENTTLNIYNFIKDFEIVYPLLTPIEIPIPQEDLKLLKSLKTEQGVTNIFVGGEVKPTIEARYALDIASIVSKLQTKLLTLQEEVVKNV